MEEIILSSYKGFLQDTYTLIQDTGKRKLGLCLNWIVDYV